MDINHFLYKTTNLKSGRFYIGIHSTYNIDDRYMGSGRELIEDINKLGKNAFKREIMCFVETRDELCELESLIVDREFVLRQDTYNIAKGGQGINSHNRVLCYDTETGNLVMVDKNNLYNDRYRLYHLGLKRSDETCKKISEFSKNKVACISENGEAIRINQEEFLSRNLKGINEDKMRIYNPDTDTEMLIDKNITIPNGYFLTRRPVTQKSKDKLSTTRKSMIWITNGIISTAINQNESIPTGWKRGRHSNGLEGYVVINDGINETKVKKGTDLPSGWVLGRIIHECELCNETYKSKKHHDKRCEILTKERIAEGY